MGGLLLPGLSISARASGYGFDVLTPPAAHAENLRRARLSGANGAWMRVRGVAEPGREGARPVAGDRVGLRRLRALGIRTLVLLRWNSEDWTGGVRPGGGHRLPLDLREAFARGRRLGAAYGDLVDGWEIENEPDIGFVADNPEVMAAFQKACYLGLKAGARDAAERAAGRSDWLEQKRGWAAACAVRPSQAAPLVVMPPLALPPGPYFERLWANGVASYTDGFNYHYYGYAEDFSGVYRQFEDAVTRMDEEGAGRLAGTPGPEAGGQRSGGLWFHGQKSRLPGFKPAQAGFASAGAGSWGGGSKTLPVFLTEYGYGLMDGRARNTTEGRVRQWRWFASVADQIRELRPEGPMAFVFNPYYEAKLNEFGLLMKNEAVLSVRWGGESAVSRASDGVSEAGAEAPVVFYPSDFGEGGLKPWMEGIGRKEGAAHASPALAYLWDYAARHPYEARDWSVRAAAPSPVVIDFEAGSDMTQLKEYGGYGLQGTGSAVPGEQPPASVRTGHGRVVLYNFSERTVRGALDFSSGRGAAMDGAAAVLTLASGERREIPVALTVSEARFSGHPVRLAFRPSRPSGPEAVYAMSLYPGTNRMTLRRLASFDFPPERAEAARAVLQARPLASEEPPLKADGRWLVSDGVRVEEAGGVWRFRVEHFPSQPLRPAMVELPLPDGFVFASDSLLVLQHRKVEEGGGPAVSVREGDNRYGPHVGRWKTSAEVYFRTANGNLYGGPPRLRPGEAWATYAQSAQNFTMWFFGRAELPWRFRENRPVALVFFLRPAELPFTLEVRNAEIATLTAGE